MEQDTTPGDILTSSYQYGSGPLSLDREGERNERRIFLIGYPISWSVAPLLHSTLFRRKSLPWDYQLFERQNAADFLPALHQPDVQGCAITMPFKVSLLNQVDELTEEARIIGAINTVFLRSNAERRMRYIGTNTDCLGIRDAFLQCHPNVTRMSKGRPALIVGAGGACRAAIYALWKWLGTSKIYLVNRLDSEVATLMRSLSDVGFQGEVLHVSSVEQAQTVLAPKLIVGCIPDFPPKTAGEILAKDIVDAFLLSSEKGYLLEMCYHPVRTRLYAAGELAGWTMIDGIEATIWQGVAQNLLWSEEYATEAGIEEVRRVVREHITEVRDATSRK